MWTLRVSIGRPAICPLPTISTAGAPETVVTCDDLTSNEGSRSFNEATSRLRASSALLGSVTPATDWYLHTVSEAPPEAIVAMPGGSRTSSAQLTG